MYILNFRSPGVTKDLSHTGRDLNKQSRETVSWPLPLQVTMQVQKFDCATPDLSETAVHFHDAGAVVGGKCPVALASEHLFTCNFSPRITMRWRLLRNEDGVANVDPTPRLRASKTRASPSLLIVQLEAPYI